MVLGVGLGRRSRVPTRLPWGFFWPNIPFSEAPAAKLRTTPGCSLSVASPADPTPRHPRASSESTALASSGVRLHDYT